MKLLYWFSVLFDKTRMEDGVVSEFKEICVGDVVEAIATAAEIVAVVRGETPETILRLFPGKELELVNIAWTYLKRRMDYSHVLKS